MSTAAIQRAQPASPVSAAINTSQIFPLKASGVSIGAPAPPASAAVLPCPGSSRLEQKRFEVRASGYCKTNGAYTVTPVLYAALVAPTGAASLVPANWTAIATGTATAVSTTSAGWILQAEMLFDSVSGKLQGMFEQNVNNSYVSRAALSAALTGVNGATEPVLTFAVGLTFNTADASNLGVLADFVLDA